MTLNKKRIKNKLAKKEKVVDLILLLKKETLNKTWRKFSHPLVNH